MRPMLCAMLALVILLGSFAFAEGGAIIEEVGGAGVDAPYEMRVYDKAANALSTIYIEYPHFLADEYAWINDIIMAEVRGIAEIVPFNRMPPDEELHRETECRCNITLLNDRIVSMVFGGYVYFHPYAQENGVSLYNHFATSNIDLTSRENYKLTRLYDVNADFIDILYSKAVASPYRVTIYDDEIFPILLALDKYYSGKIGNLLFNFPSDVIFYMTDKGIVIRLTAHVDAAEPFFEAQILYDDIEHLYLLPEKLWGE